MKILMVAIPNHHFFQWVNQLQSSGHEVFWFDVTDGGSPSDKIAWVRQYKGWKLRWDFPFRSRVKKYFPKVYSWIQRFNERPVANAFEQVYKQIQPDVVHGFEMQLAGLPILPVMQQNNTPFIYSSWGSDLFYFETLGVSKQAVTSFLKRCDYLITDCKRDYHAATQLGFTNKFLGVFPGNGGLTIPSNYILPAAQRDVILIKGYDDGVGKASVVLEALALLDPVLLEHKRVVVYSADRCLDTQIKASSRLSQLAIALHYRENFMPNTRILELMGQSCLHIGNSLSDGMPNALLEAMGMGAFPVQSNPGGVTAEVIIHGNNGLLIENPMDAFGIGKHIELALKSPALRSTAQDYNVRFIADNYQRHHLQNAVVQCYQFNV